MLLNKKIIIGLLAILLPLPSLSSPFFIEPSKTNTTSSILTPDAFQAELSKRQQQHIDVLNNQLKDNLSKLQPPMPEPTPQPTTTPQQPEVERNITPTTPSAEDVHPVVQNMPENNKSQPEQQIYSGFATAPNNSKNSSGNGWNINY